MLNINVLSQGLQRVKEHFWVAKNSENAIEVNYSLFLTQTLFLQVSFQTFFDHLEISFSSEQKFLKNTSAPREELNVFTIASVFWIQRAFH